ncbi:AAA family ATPase [uncultured Selenomonas sp.]|uniref:AAA family ATPase n=1 Tax=uncultured Selenomonas sp. TaxID=159275 RepID=UPI0028EA536E|nr:AAA family ATPase [uncultured Selenomonas sp.]
MLADILSKENILPTGRFIECGRSDLVAKYVGWTAVCVKEKFRAARGEILFIDEAYALLDDRSGSYGDEAISTIVQEMENHREDVIVIFAGYPKKMQDFLDANEGLRSRIAFHVSFPDYTADELAEILSLIARQQGYTLTEEIVTHCRTQFSSMCRQEDFGNGRFVRNVFEQALMKQSQRLWALREHHALTEDSLRQLTVADFNVAALQPAERRQTSMGFSVSHG